MIDEPPPARATVLRTDPSGPERPGLFAGDGRGLMIGVLVAMALVGIACVVLIAMTLNAGVDTIWQRAAERHAVERAANRRAVEAAAQEDAARAIAPPPVTSTDPATWITSDDYPAEALRANQQGIVSITWVVDPGGRVGDCKTAQSSGYPSLDRAACDAIQRRARYPAIPANQPPRVFSRRVVWKIPG